MAATACVAEAGTITSCRGHAQGDFWGQCPFPGRIKGTRTHAWILLIWTTEWTWSPGVLLYSHLHVGQGPSLPLKKQMRGAQAAPLSKMGCEVCRNRARGGLGPT